MKYYNELEQYIHELNIVPPIKILVIVSFCFEPYLWNEQLIYNLFTTVIKFLKS